MAELSCTCGPGASVAGTRQEIVEQRLASISNLTVSEVHALLDLLDRTNDAVLDIPDGKRDPEGGETERLMAQESGRTEGWIKNFLAAWEFISAALDQELHEKYGPWGGLFGKRT
jgi:hypothetical protein